MNEVRAYCLGQLFRDAVKVFPNFALLSHNIE